MDGTSRQSLRGYVQRNQGRGGATDAGLGGGVWTHGVRVNTVAPGVTLTPGNEASKAILDQIVAGTPAGVLVQPDDIARGVVFLVSEDAAMIHGITLDIDGGISSTQPS